MADMATYPSLKGRTVFITGGGSGIGASIVRHFCAQGSKVGFVDSARAPSQALVAAIAAAGDPVPTFIECDLHDIAALRTAIAAIAAKLGPITVLVNAATHDDDHKPEGVTPEYWDDRISAGLKHQFFAAQAVADGMKQVGGGSIINLGSMGWVAERDGRGAHSAAESANLSLTKCLARDLGRFNIRCNSIAPGWITTQPRIDLWLHDDRERDQTNRQSPMQELGPDDIAPAVLFLAADDSGAMTNQSYMVDVGWV